MRELGFFVHMIVLFWLYVKAIITCLKHQILSAERRIMIIRLKLASFEGDQRPYRGHAASPVGAAVLAHVARSGRLGAALR